MKLKTFTIKLMSIATAAATAFAVTASLPLTPTASAADTDTTPETQSTLPTSLQNGDFESPGIQEILDDTYWAQKTSHGTTLGYYNNYTISENVNYSLNWNSNKLYPDIITYRADDAWFVTSKDIFDEISDNKFYWETTDYNQRVELALDTKGMDKYFGDGKATASSGSQFAELVPESPSSLYQTISTPDEKVLSWSLDHRARNGNTDIMAVFIGPKQEYLKKTSDDANDIFMEMAALLKTEYDTMPIGSQIGPYTIYSKKIDASETIDNTFVSTTKYGDYTEEWQCWIVKSGSDKWYTHSGTYTVPEGQKETTLAFTAMTTSQSSKIEGNCLDNIRLGELFPLTLTAMPGGTGYMQPNDKGSAAVNVDGNTTDNNSKSQLYEKGEAVTITAKPEGNYIFTGAIINGKNVGVDEFVKSNDTYTYEVTIDQTYNVVLTFAQKGFITYDANGGTLSYDNDNSIYTHEFTEINSTLKTPPTATYDNKTFLGWRLLAANENREHVEVTKELIPADHHVTYSTNDSKAELTISWDNNKSITLPASQDDAVLLLAVYQQTLSVVPMTRYIGETSYTENDDGGIVTVNNNTNENTSGSSCTITAGNEYTITTTPKDGFRLDRLYYYDVNGRIIPLEVNTNSYTAKFSSNRDITVYAEFSEIPIDAHYSFVPENENTQNVPAAFVKDPSDESIGQYSGQYGGNEYGNTISTGFFTTRMFSTSIKPSGIWTIQIPENRTYFKIPSDATAVDYPNLNLDSEVLIDSDTVQFNKGKICGVKDNGGTTNITLRAYVHSDTTISGEGSVQFGIIIDNLYAPEARAGFKETSTPPDNVIELNGSNSIYTSDKNYEHDENILSGNTYVQTID